MAVMNPTRNTNEDLLYTFNSLFNTDSFEYTVYKNNDVFQIVIPIPGVVKEEVSVKSSSDTLTIEFNPIQQYVDLDEWQVYKAYNTTPISRNKFKRQWSLTGLKIEKVTLKDSILRVFLVSNDPDPDKSYPIEE
jgi:HSP20 family molecular chaperone IbpA